MKTRHILAAAALVALAAPAAAQDVAIRNATIMTVTNGTIENGTILVRNGTIAAVGRGHQDALGQADGGAVLRGCTAHREVRAR